MMGMLYLPNDEEAVWVVRDIDNIVDMRSPALLEECIYARLEEVHPHSHVLAVSIWSDGQAPN